ncbi:Fungal specific transcription factor domain containing protein [Hyaloscypha variabilis]
MSTSAAALNGRSGPRAKRACKTCNSRRVKCNVTDEQPCKNCRSAGSTCELRTSRRGKYDRKASFPRAVSQARSISETPSGRHEQPNSEQTHVEDHRHQRSIYSRSESTSQAQGVPNHENYPNGTPRFHFTPPSGIYPDPTSNSADSTVFLGESNSISLVHGPQAASSANHSSPADKTRLRYPIPDAVSIKASTFESRRKAARLEYLTKEGAFTFPSSEICEVLLRAYFEWFHPCFPILDRYRFSVSYSSKSISALLLHSVLFVGATHCNENMYNRAKDLYDADYETDKITVSQALFLMSFWRAGPLLEKDTRHWLGAAISLAQTKGMHRSSSTSTFVDAKLRKRIWWSLYIRDRQCSAALGLPTRIRDEDCDIEMLDPSDFEEEDYVSLPNYLGVQKTEHILYAIEMARLARYLGKIVLREFSPVDAPKKDAERARLKDDLSIWESELSPEMSASATANSLWASMLHLAYNNLYILLYRSAYLAESDDQSAGNVALHAACRNTRIIEDVLSQDLVQHSNVHVTTSLFNSLCIHTICLRRSQNTARKLAEYRAQLCLLGLRELQKTWDVTNWVLQLFLQFLDQATAKKLQPAAEVDEPSAPHAGAVHGLVATPGPGANTEGMEDFASGATGYGFGDAGMGQQGLGFASHLFATKEAEDFSMFQLQPGFYLSGDIFGGGLDQYYNSIQPRGEDPRL